MLTPHEQELLRRVADEVDAYLEQSDRLKAFLARWRASQSGADHSRPIEIQ